MIAVKLLLLLVFAATACYGRHKEHAVHARRPETRRRMFYRDRCGDTNQIPYTPRGATKSPLPLASIPDRCKGSKSMGDRLLVTDTVRDVYATEWIQREIEIPHLIYYTGGTNESHKHVNAGREAAGYLTYIAEYYECLPEVTLFAHPHKESYHTYRSLDRAVELVQWEKIPGYASLHPHGVNWAEFNPHDPVSNLGEPLQPTPEEQDKLGCEQIFNDTAYDYWASWEYRRAEYVSKAWDNFFGQAGFGEMPERLRMWLVGEFFVRRENIRLRPREFYLKALQWSIEAIEAGLFTDWQMGVVFELTWHYIFGQPAYMTGVTVEPCVLYKCEDKQ